MTTPTTDARGLIERLARALEEANDYVASELSEERAKFAGYEHASDIAGIEADQKRFASLIAEADAYLSTNPAETGSKSVDGIEQRARELLAAEYERNGLPMEGSWARDGSGTDSPYIRAIIAALRSAERPNAPDYASATDEELHLMNNALCDFAMRWRLDGDYLRCRACDRPHLASYSNLDFQHAANCKNATVAEPKPWETLVGMLAPLRAATTAAEQPSAPEPVAWIHEDELPASYPYDAMFPHSKVDGVRMFPVFAPFAPRSDDAPCEAASGSEWESALSSVMPKDFGDWWQNSRKEWPQIAAGVIESLRERERLAWEQVGPREAAQEPVGFIPQRRPGAPFHPNFDAGDFSWMDASSHDGGDDENWVSVPLYTHPAPQQRDRTPSASDALHCPFCGSADISDGEVLGEEQSGSTFKQSECQGCGALGPKAALSAGEMDFGDVKAIAAWNRRVSSAPLRPVTDEDAKAAIVARNAAITDNSGDAVRGMRAALECDRRRLAGESA